MEESARETVALNELAPPKSFLGLSLVLLLAVSFTLDYLSYNYYSNTFLNVESMGFWLLLYKVGFMVAVVLINKKASGWLWSDLGFARPPNWWNPVLTAVATFTAVILLSLFLKPLLLEIGGPQNTAHLAALRGNLPLLLFALLLVWIAAAFVQELVFRAFLINTLDSIFGNSIRSTWFAVLISALLFGLVHTWQGLSGILFTAAIGLVFGIVYILNGRRIWALIFVHGLLDSITLVSIYNS
ncbi:CPBP family intramembrane glutamic endopeptidase [Salinimicrobium flavum]|uniref:CPBP family intramembrane glutamic endopeptidase n=1 Tax=Salinimicrobium flavum TaxID=1737065 RepID=A0ABW5IUE4_9FLAO